MTTGIIKSQMKQSDKLSVELWCLFGSEAGQLVTLLIIK
jgi:hypothetical protein